MNAFCDRDRGMLVHSLGAFSDMQVLLLVQKYLLPSSVQKYLLTAVDMQAAADESYTVTTCVTITSANTDALTSTKVQILTPAAEQAAADESYTFTFCVQVGEHVDARHRLLLNFCI